MEVGKMNNEQQKYVGWEAVQTPVPRLRIGTDEGEHFLIPWGLMRAGGSSDAAMAEYGMFGGMVFRSL